MKNLILTALLVAAAPLAYAQPALVATEGAWARATVQGQKATGAFMRLVAREKLTLTGVSSPVAGVAEVHEMKLEGDVMRMRAIPSLELPAGQPVELKPGGHHLMLMDLKAPLMPDTAIPVTLTLRNARGETSRLDVNLPVLTRAPQGAAHRH